MPHRPRAGTAVAGLALFAAAAAVGFGVVPAPAADAATPRPAVPHVVKVVAISSSAFTVRVGETAHATSFRVYVARTKRGLHVARIRHARHSASQRSRLVTIRRLRYRATPYYYRVEAVNGKRHRWDTTIHAVRLRPPTPAGLRATAGHAGTYLTWRAEPATGWQITRSTRRNFSAGRRTYRIRGANPSFTPYGLVKGRTYWFRVQAMNGSTKSAPAAAVHATPRTALQSIRIATYNVLEANTAGALESGVALAAWPARRAGVVASIRKSGAAVVAVQEAAAWIGSPTGFGGTRQIDDLRRALGGDWSLATTETPPTTHGFRRTADYVLYRSRVYQPAAAGGHWSLGDQRWAAYQLLRNRATGARVIAVSPHLLAGAGARYDTLRQREATRLLAFGAAYARSTGAPIVYAGDFNSTVNRNHVFDGPGIVMRAAHVADSADAAQHMTNGQYNSANLNMRRPPTVGQSIDHIYAPPGVAVVSRTVVVKLVHGRFVGAIPSDHNLVEARLAFPY
ncbi:endonuclease/exonuclease/phosphatase family protein [uncultured Jatrophihabitans sp.]|uniref:endonuclease/exonuclease/phosphatase family protein n=1 Tax=uncultured Jatrophihabitans sp. TaxID=1610747 RepID=UPI0035CB51C7